MTSLYAAAWAAPSAVERTAIAEAAREDGAVLVMDDPQTAEYEEGRADETNHHQFSQIVLLQVGLGFEFSKNEQPQQEKRRAAN